MDKIVEVRGMKPEAACGNVADKCGTGFVARVIQLAPARIAAEMLRVLRIQKSALVVIEPPCESRAAAVFEIDNGVFIAIEKLGSKRLVGAMGHAGIAELCARMNYARDEAAEVRRGGCAIETVVVIENTFNHETGKTFKNDVI